MANRRTRTFSGPLGLSLLVFACTPGFTPPTLTSADIEQTSETGATSTSTGEPDDPTTSSSSSGDGGWLEDPCAACGAGEYCHYFGADDSCPGLPATAECRPLPDGCDLGDLCTDLACTVQICEGYDCSIGVNPCGLGGAVQCGGRGCDLLDSAACGVAGTTCLPVSDDADLAWESTACVPAPQPGVAVGGACTLLADEHWQWGDCEPGAVCHPLDADTGQGVCKSLCTADERGAPSVCADPDHACVPWDANDVPLALCEPTCDPLDPLACPAGDACVPTPAQAQREFVCIREFSGDAGATFDPCEFINACDPGLLCGPLVPGCDRAAKGCCLPFCDVDQPVCPDGLICTPYFAPGDAPAGHEDVGLCAQ